MLDESLDGVIVASPPATHLPIAERFIEQSVPVLVEKPLCLDYSAAARFRDLAVAHRGLVFVDHVHLFSPAFRLLKQLSPSLGRITGIVSAGGRQGPFRSDTPALWDWGSHDLAMVLDLVGSEPLQVSGRRTSRTAAGSGGFAENFELSLQFPNEIPARTTIGNGMAPVRKFEVGHVQGTLIYDDLAEHKLAFRGRRASDDARIRAEIAASEPFRLPLDCALESFCDAIRARRPDPHHLELAVSVVRILEQIDQSLHRGRSP
jgi:predicted dehydrogenase